MPGPTRPGRRVAITGASGLIGFALSQVLRDRGDQVVHLVRREASSDVPPHVTEVSWDPSGGRLDRSALVGVDAVVHLAGAGVADHRWTREYKDTIRSSRVEGTTTVSAAVADLSPVPRLVSASGVDVYGDRGADVLTEESRTGEGFLAEVCRDWEAATWQAQDAGGSVAHARSGIVLAPRGGAMVKVLPLAKFGLTGPLGHGGQYWPWITLHDEVRALLFLVDRPGITGAVNLTGLEPDTQVDVIRALGDHLHRPGLLPAPTIALRLALGEMAAMVLASHRVLPAVLTEAGFTFEHPDLDAAMTWLLGQGDD